MHLSPNIKLTPVMSLWSFHFHYSTNNFTTYRFCQFISSSLFAMLQTKTSFHPHSYSLNNVVLLTIPWQHSFVSNLSQDIQPGIYFILFWNNTQISVFHQIFNTNWIFSCPCNLHPKVKIHFFLLIPKSFQLLQ